MKKLSLKEALNVLREKVKRYDDTHNFTCDVCGREVFLNERICDRCHLELPWNNQVVCPYCGRKVLEEGVCLDCKEKRIEGVEKARSCFVHEGEAARLVHRFKRGEKFLCRTLGEVIYPLFLKEFSNVDAITFVPMTKKAEKRRGYNQSKLLAEELGRQSDVPVIDAVIKQKETSAQKTLGRRDRENNLKGCFHVSERSAVKGKHLLLIDDTLTTGATAGELASCFMRAGAHAVSVLTVTSVPRKNPFGILEKDDKEV